jgi:23S rRNA (cytosine1962-C5)-methyltransferase
MTHPHLAKQIVLRKNEERRVVAGHPWVFSNEIRESKGDPQAGDVVELLAASGLTLGVGLYNPHSLIAFRLLSPALEEIGEDFFRRAISAALVLRSRLYGEATTYRLIHGEGDFLSGLVVDRYEEYLSLQTFSCGMDIRLPLICDVLESMFHPRGIVERNESPLRSLENLPARKGILRGSIAPVTFLEHGLSYTVDLLEGQKTGFFLDQRENRASIRRFSRNARVLDCFCNDGGFALNAAQAGALSVLGIDSSGEAILRAKENARRNAISVATFEQDDVFQRLQTISSTGEQFDLIVLDPPSFTRSRKNVQSAKKGYRDLHESAFRTLRKDGMLLTASCSHHIEPDVFLNIVNDSARRVGKSIQLLDWRGAAPDHPTLPGVPETRYLKFGIFRTH